MQSQHQVQGYYRHPSVFENAIVFVSEDDLWTVEASGGVARRLTAGLAECAFPSVSPDGKFIAFVSSEEGQPDVYLMPILGGQPKRLTYLGATGTRVIGWHDGKIIFSTNAKQPFLNIQAVYALSPEGGEPEPFAFGTATYLSFGAENQIVLGRNSADAARWKRYRGGTAGEIWWARSANEPFENFSKKLGLKGNFNSPIWIQENGAARIYFVSDHDGVANLYSALPDATDLKRHTHHTDFYVRYPQKDASGKNRIVYHAGADIFLYDIESGESAKVEIDFCSPRTQRNRKFVGAGAYLEHFSLHPNSSIFALNARGKAFSLPLKSGPVLQYAERQGVRYRLATFLHDGEHVAMTSDAADDQEILEIYNGDNVQVHSFEHFDIGIARFLQPNPKNKLLAVGNNRNELKLIDIDNETAVLIEQNSFGAIGEADWSPCGRYLAYSSPISMEQTEIKIYDTKTGKTHPVTEPVLRDYCPAFSVDGKYLYFLSDRIFDPVYDNLLFDLNFPRGTKPYLLTLQKDLTSPFFEEPASRAKEEPEEKSDSETPEIDFENIAQRVLEIPVPEGRYVQLAAADGMLLLGERPIMGALSAPKSDDAATGIFHAFKFSDKKLEKITDKLSHFEISQDRKMVMYRSGKRLCYGSLEELLQPGKTHDAVELKRVKISIEPPQEWRQMLKEAWRLQKEHYWTPDMAGLDWQEVFDRYEPLLNRVGSRAEFSDLTWEMQGELGTSHCYEYGGDYRPKPPYHQGLLGADISYSTEKKAFEVTGLPKGDFWKEGEASPLHTPGVNVQVGDLILEVNGQSLSKNQSFGELLVSMAGQEITLTVANAKKENMRRVRIKPIASEQKLRYRDWVEKNRALVKSASDGKIGYVHIPNMGPLGYAEFFRGYLKALRHPGLIIDVRFNGGGHVSQLLLEKLAQRRIGYDIQRWAKIPEPYPAYAPFGAVVALTNEFAGSDGDIFSHAFKLMKIGPLLGKRTWGGVIGINPRHSLSDGTVTTQPEYSFWFEDVGWNVENYGTDPDIEVEFAPHDYAANLDPQLTRAIEETLSLIETRKPAIPDFSKNR
ncbi:peptidase S41 [Chloroherpeton thalassium ATCC 35110]|uniref:Tricorn protease homolog n=1 Tax=Chloroherpeton thalassium (strain ATCC 35110 / GB-78) TaxID=517418 RepID=B3QU45_CHLT3|nr:S41 family peptidase [Chloroherpeton thalassium]ACF12843.1 peptidase S41 [Chloroherpeton thalassium ATCC 35110]